MKKKKRRTMLLLVLALAIGFASVSTTLIINGTIGIEKNNDNFVKGVVFDEESLLSSNGTTAEISESGRTITFVTQEMKSIDETATVNFKIKNYSQYNAVLGTPAISCYFVDDYQVDTVDETTPKVTTNEYMQLIPGSELNGATITAGGGLSAESKVTVKQIKSYVGETTSVKFQCVINATAVESETAGIEKPAPASGTYELVADTDNDGIADIGDEIAIGEEHFYVISHTDKEINALAKYNLMVGNEVDSSSWEVTPLTNPTGIQDPRAKGNVDGDTKYYGTIAFSNTQAWAKGADPIDIKTQTDGPVKEVLYGDNGYEKYIQKTIPNATVRLITYDETQSLIGYSWLYDTSYWTQSADSDYGDRVWSVNSDGGVSNNRFNNDFDFGVRPVVVISEV